MGLILSQKANIKGSTKSSSTVKEKYFYMLERKHELL